MNKKSPTITIGIPTYETGKSLVIALRSLYKQTAFAEVKEIIVAVDGKKLPVAIAKQIENPKLRVISYPKRKGQSARINDLCAEATTDFLVLTNDDIVVRKDAIEKILKRISRSYVDLIGCHVDAISTKSFIEKIINTGKEMNMTIASQWNKGDNFLHCNGRLIVLSKKLYNTIHIPELLWNNDAYIYLFNHHQNGKFSYLPNAIGYYKIPQTLSEHLKQSLKFQLSLHENQQYFTTNLETYYQTPSATAKKVFFNHIIKTPLLAIGYLGVYAFTRVMRTIKKPSLPTRGFWETDKTTKEIIYTD